MSITYFIANGLLWNLYHTNSMPTKAHLDKVMVFPVVVYGCESWTIKKGERWRIDASEPWCWRRLFKVPWIARRSNQSILKEMSPEYSLEGLMLKLKLQYFGHLMRRADSFKRPWCWQRLGAGEGDDRGWDGWMASPTQWTWVWVGSRSWWWTGRRGVLQSMGPQRVRHYWVTELNWEKSVLKRFWGLLWWLSHKESTCQCRRHGFHPWSRKTTCCRGTKPAPQPLSLCSRAGEWQEKPPRATARKAHIAMKTQP